MQRRTLGIATLAIAAVISGLVAGKLSRSSANAAAETAAARLLDSTLESPDGTPVTLRQWRGKTLVVNFWATWCPPCREEMPGFSRLSGKLAANGVQFVGIADDSADKVRAFAQRAPVAYPLLMASDAAVALEKDLGNGKDFLPFTVIIRPDGRVSDVRVGLVPEAEMARLLQQ